MAHSPAELGSRADPDLTAMLDMVMQLLMYFIMCVNFSSQEYSEDVKLPEAQSARPMGKGEGDLLRLDLLTNGNVKPVGKNEMEAGELRDWLQKKHLDALSHSKDGKNHTTILLRADKDANYESVYKVMHLCKEEHFNLFKLHAIKAGGE
jgi:biopolymer transport protein ExbD